MGSIIQNVTDGRQLKAGRVILGLTVEEVAKLANLHKNSVIRVESHTTLPHHTYAADRIKKSLENLGICFEIKTEHVGLFFPASIKRAKKPYVRRVPKVH